MCESTIAPGTMLLDKYRVEKVLGAGGMGVVMAVLHVELDELFAMKVMKPAVREIRGATQRFLQEARAAAKLRSPHVAHVYDVGHLEDGTPYMVMEHLAGADLRGILEREGPLEASRVVDYLLQALEAIVEAHGAGIVHRDLKPDNLFLTGHLADRPMIKVLDFGISKNLLLGDDVAVSSPVAPGAADDGELAGARTTSIVGSPYYMAPEQIRVSPEVDTRADIWSLGVIAYELLAGDVPFQGRTNMEVCRAVVEGEGTPLQSVAPGVPGGLVRIIERCLQHAPDDRFQSAADLLEALKLVEGELREKPALVLEEVTPPVALRGGTSIKRVGAIGSAAFAMVSVAATLAMTPSQVVGATALSSVPVSWPVDLAARMEMPASFMVHVDDSGAAADEPSPAAGEPRSAESTVRPTRWATPPRASVNRGTPSAGILFSPGRHRYEGIY